MNFQPVIPLSLNSEWNLSTRTTMPIIKTEPAHDERRHMGIGRPPFLYVPLSARLRVRHLNVEPSIQLPTDTSKATATCMDRKSWAPLSSRFGRLPGAVLLPKSVVVN